MERSLHKAMFERTRTTVALRDPAGHGRTAQVRAGALEVLFEPRTSG